MNDAAIIELFWNRDEQAIIETKLKYGRLCTSLASNMLDSLEDAEECVSDTYFTVWNCIPTDKPNYFSAYLCKITKNLVLKKIAYNSAVKRSTNMSKSIDEIGEMLSNSTTPEDEYDLKELSAALSRFLRKRKEKNRQIFIRRYWYYASIEDIAEIFGMTENNVSLVLFRERKALKEFLKKEGFDI